jgi:HSP20 family molecular chaperone IbpA
MGWTLDEKIQRTPLEQALGRITSATVEAKLARRGRRQEGGVSVSMLLKEDVVMRTYDFAPLFRSTVGFDRLFDMLENSTRPDWPPYNIERVGENQYRISMAIAGFGPTEIELTQQGNTLLVTGQKNTELDNHEMLGVLFAKRSMSRAYSGGEGADGRRSAFPCRRVPPSAPSSSCN